MSIVLETPQDIDSAVRKAIDHRDAVTSLKNDVEAVQELFGTIAEKLKKLEGRAKTESEWALFQQECAMNELWRQHQTVLMSTGI